MVFHFGVLPCAFFVWMLSPLVLLAVKLHSLQVFGSNWFGVCCMFGGAFVGDGAFAGVGGNDIAMLFNSFVSESIFKVSFGG